MAAMIVSIVFGSLSVVVTMLGAAWKLSGKLTLLSSSVSALAAETKKLDKRLEEMSHREAERDQRLLRVEAKIGAMA